MQAVEVEALAGLLRAAIRAVDQHLGDGYAKKNPAVLVEALRAATALLPRRPGEH